MPKQRKQQEEKTPVNGRLVDFPSSSSLLSVQRSEDGEQEYSQRMNNPKQQLQKANSYGFNFGNIPIYPSGRDGQQGELGRERSRLQTHQSPIQAKRISSVIQRDEAVQDGLADIKASGTVPEERWLLDSIVTVPTLGSPKFKDPVRFARLCQFAHQEDSDEHTNVLVLVSSVNWDSPHALLAVAEKICLNDYISPSDYKYQQHLPQVNYPTSKPPEDVNLSGSLAQQLCKAYTDMEASISMSAGEAHVQAIVALSQKITDIAGESWSFLRRDTFPRLKGQLEDRGYGKAGQIHGALNNVWGGARKRRILGGYHEGARR